ncbi:DNA polymerase III subunit beta [Planctomycetes bacterium Pan216]|uniref:Beta sliding clamp n=1 Tax=Kolteria novifilia TaxID=2527975 RepID=A0A518AWQ9_9BACT|nr:DNA polymerase III subunit beta [Planctomycetes bacterium Pan216]
MKLTANREGLLTAFQVVSSVVPARSTKPILTQIKLEASQEQSVLLATDLEMGVRYQVSGLQIQEPGQAVLRTSEVGMILRELPDEMLEIEATDSGITIAGAASRFELPASDPLQFPEIPDFGDRKGHRIKAGVLATMVKRTHFSVAPENSRYALHSLLIDFVDDKMQMVSTDGKRLALMPGQVTLEGERPEQLSLVPPRTLTLVQKTVLDPEEEIEIALSDNDILLRSSKVTVYSRLVEGRFPRYQDVIPSETGVQVPLTVGTFQAAVRQAKIVTTGESKGVDFRFSEGMLTLESRASDVGQSEVRLPIGYDGEELIVTFDPQLLLDALRVLDDEEEIILGMTDAKKASVLKTRDGYSYVVMPLTRER